MNFSYFILDFALEQTHQIEAQSCFCFNHAIGVESYVASET